MNPTFDSTDLVDHAAAEVLVGSASRTTREQLPDVAGEFFQVYPPGGREIVVRGVLTSALQVSAALASADLKAKIRARQGRAGEVATYRGVDGQAHADSLLLSYRQAGPIQVSPAGGAVRALANVEARIVTQP